MLGKAQIKGAEIFGTMLDNLWLNSRARHTLHQTRNSIHTHTQKNNEGCPGWATLCTDDLSTQL